jgi:hypothetical protein
VPESSTGTTGMPFAWKCVPLATMVPARPLWMLASSRLRPVSLARVMPNSFRQLSQNWPKVRLEADFVLLTIR